MNKDLEKSFGFNRKSLKMTCRAIELDGTQDAAVLAILAAEKDLLTKIEAVLAAPIVQPTAPAAPAPVVPAASAVPAAIDGDGLVV